MTEFAPTPIEFTVKLLRDGETFGVRYACVCGCRPQVRLRRGSPAAHEHCCCGIAHTAGPDARLHLERYLAERKTHGQDADRAYVLADTSVLDPWGNAVPVAYAVPHSPMVTHASGTETGGGSHGEHGAG